MSVENGFLSSKTPEIKCSIIKVTCLKLAEMAQSAACQIAKSTLLHEIWRHVNLAILKSPYLATL